jgi:hypothetical protein
LAPEFFDPELVEAANMLAEWREKYQNEITVRTKKRWWRRMFKVSGKEERRNRKMRSWDKRVRKTRVFMRV